MLMTPSDRGLGPFWQNLYAQCGDFLNETFIQNDVFKIHLVTKCSESVPQHAA
jgi:hypothetical protein